MKRWIPRVMVVLAVVMWAQAAVGDARAATTSVDVMDFEFIATTVNVAVGDTVEWTWTGSAPHTVTADDGSFDSGILNNGATFSRTFNTPGQYRYYCTLHGSPGGGGMAGVVNVEAAPTVTATVTTAASSPTAIAATNTPTRTATVAATGTAVTTGTPPASTPTVPEGAGTVVAPAITAASAGAAAGADALPSAGDGGTVEDGTSRWFALAVVGFGLTAAGVAVRVGVRSRTR